MVGKTLMNHGAEVDVVFQPADSAVDVAVTLYDGGGDTGATAAQMRAEDWSVGAPGRSRASPPTDRAAEPAVGAGLTVPPLAG
jgi:hypothetical protein